MKKILHAKQNPVSYKWALIKNLMWKALAGVAQWIECEPVTQRVASSIPSQGTCLGGGPGSQYGVNERQPHTDVSLPLFLPLSKNKYIKSFKNKNKIK